MLKVRIFSGLKITVLYPELLIYDICKLNERTFFLKQFIDISVIFKLINAS